MRALLLRLLAASLFTHAASASPGEPSSPPASDQAWHRSIPVQRDQLSVRRADICLLGDSLMEFWDHHGKAAWSQTFGDWHTVNCGVAGDRVENIWYRAERLNLDQAHPRVVILLAGTNNLSAEASDTPEAVARGCVKLAERIRAVSPKTQVLLLSIPPSGSAPDTRLRQTIRATNSQLAGLAAAAHVSFLDIYPLFADEKDRWRAGLDLDGTHLSAAGYEVLAAALKPVVEPLLATGDK
jgi:lysophospholipase L1-like esterase